MLSGFASHGKIGGSSRLVFAGLDSSLVVYSDSECTTPVFLFDPGTDVARVPVANTCQSEFRLYRCGSELFIGDTMYLTDGYSRCRGVTNGSLKSYAMGAEVDVNALPVIDDDP